MAPTGPRTEIRKCGGLCDAVTCDLIPLARKKLPVITTQQVKPIPVSLGSGLTTLQAAPKDQKLTVLGNFALILRKLIFLRLLIKKLIIKKDKQKGVPRNSEGFDGNILFTVQPPPAHSMQSLKQ